MESSVLRIPENWGDLSRPSWPWAALGAEGERQLFTHNFRSPQGVAKPGGGGPGAQPELQRTKLGCSPEKAQRRPEPARLALPLPSVVPVSPG